ncbi:acyl-CoA dehydrogenase C-terminal domain-containing protein [Hoeflea sp. Naph1]|uniref:acyl-CoA dehydrogenase C-terminal domain-containing protein n=1 Tax=Hoeflea sp. Naph1 TaxID=3388653 RepID=UPI00398FE47C
MAAYVAPTTDIAFLLKEVFDFDGLTQTLPGYEDMDSDLAVSVLEEAGKFCAEVLEPLNRSGDEEGSTLKDGVVSTPKGFAEAYKAFVEAGWGGLSGDTEFGGQGLPSAIQLLFDEMVTSTNMAFGLFSGLTHGAVEAINHHASQELKERYLPKMISGEWTGAMALTEPSAGTDLGLLTTRAVPLGDGSFRINGTKIFISSGDQDVSDNIVHLVLARLPDAPKGVKGISLFLAPKYLVNEDGSLGARNGMSVGSLEHKMGIRAQPTCMMNYDGATAWMVGEPGRGLNAMFTMMNNERLFVGIQGLGIAEAANQKATSYALERLQGRGIDGAPGPVPIIQHPDVRKMLLTGRSFIDAARALGIWTAFQMDIASHHPDPEERKRADGFVALLTPVVKAAFTDGGLETAISSQMVFGGHGYIREWGMEQYVRDVRITQIYEGTNGVQAMDLVGRKLPMENGQLTARFIALLRQDLQDALSSPAAEHVAKATGKALDQLERATAQLMANQSDQSAAGVAATDYLRLFGLTASGWMWTKMAAKAPPDTPLGKRKLACADFYADRILPQAAALEVAIAAGSASTMALHKELF